jgi:excisionase family DNA binding protein
MTITPKKFVTVKEAARLTGIEYYTIRNMIKRKEIVGFLRGHRLYMVGLDENSELCYVIPKGSDAI